MLVYCNGLYLSGLLHWFLLTLCSTPTLRPPPPPTHPAQGEARSAPAGETRFSWRWQARAERPAGTRASEGKNQPRPPPRGEPGTRPQAPGELPQDRGVSRWRVGSGREGGADRSQVQIGELLLEEVLFTPERRCARCPVVGSGVGDLLAAQGQRPEVPVLRGVPGSPGILCFIFVFCNQSGSVMGPCKRCWASEPRL